MGDDLGLSTSPKDIVYGNQIRGDLKLLEVPEHLLEEILQKGADFKAATDSSQVYLCTQNCTYAVKTNDNTHHVALVQPEEAEKEQLVLSVLPNGRFEVVENVPSIDRVYWMVQERPYDGSDDIHMEENGSTTEGGLYTLHDLWTNSQVSMGEIRDALEDMRAFVLNGFWRTNGNKYFIEIVDQIILRIKSHGWDLAAVPASELEENMANEGYKIPSVQACLSWLGKRSVDGNEEYWILDHQKLCIHFARRLLMQPIWNTIQFMEEWSRIVPSGLMPSRDMLLGEAISDEAQGTLKRFCKDDLPKECRARVYAIFAEKDLWAPDELHAYLCDAKFPGDWSIDVAILELCQKCRFQVNDPDMYCLRRSAFRGS